MILGDLNLPIEKVKKTVGEASAALLKGGDNKQGVIDTQQAMLKEHADELVKCALNGAAKYGKEKPFYVVVITKRERLLQNVVRNFIFHRQTRPMPDYDTALYHYEPKSEQLQFVWCIPSPEKVAETLQPGYEIPNDEHQLHGFIHGFLKGTLI